MKTNGCALRCSNGFLKIFLFHFLDAISIAQKNKKSTREYFITGKTFGI